jgi:hypothetical protein
MKQPGQPSLFSADELPVPRHDEGWELPTPGRVPRSEKGLEIAANLQMELMLRCLYFAAALRDVGVEPTPHIRKRIVDEMTVLSDAIQLTLQGTAATDDAPDLVAEALRTWKRVAELREELFATLPPGAVRVVEEMEIILVDEGLEDLVDDTEGDEDVDFEFEDESCFDNFLSDRLEEALRENQEKRVLPPGFHLLTLLRALPVECLDAICETVGVKHQRLRKDRQKMLVSLLTDPDELEDLLYQLAPEEIDALRFLLEHDGSCKAMIFTRRFGDDSGDNYFWTENPPASVLGQLRLRGLVFVGQLEYGKQKCRTVAIPAELRKPLAAALDEFILKEIDPEAMVRSARRTAAAWCEDAFPIPDEPVLADEDRELAIDAVLTVADMMAEYQGELPHEWTASALMECLTEDIPRKISAEDDFFDAIPGAMCTVLEHAADAGRLERGRDLAKLIASETDAIRRAARDPKRWGMAKSAFMAALGEGVDPRDSFAMDGFIERWNERVSPPADQRRSSKVGRNQPCPCGSGKKHKRCCGA